MSYIRKSKRQTAGTKPNRFCVTNSEGEKELEPPNRHPGTSILNIKRKRQIMQEEQCPPILEEAERFYNSSCFPSYDPLGTTQPPPPGVLPMFTGKFS